MFIIQSGEQYYMGGSYTVDGQRYPYMGPKSKAKPFLRQNVAQTVANTINNYAKDIPKCIVVEGNDV